MTSYLSNRMSYLLFGCLLGLWAGPASAQEIDRWYRVELLVFSHENARSAEQWEAIPSLAYPAAARFLVEPDRVEANLDRYRADSIVDEYGRQILTILPEPDQSPGQDIPAAPDPNVPPAVTETTEPRLPTPFVALPASQREFRGKAAYMQRSGRYRTLFHQAWVQPVAESEGALPLILDRSGDTGDWPRLQGSITLYLSRYLHLQTDLWLNTPGDYLPGEWQMPPPPLGPPSVIVVELPIEEPEEQETFGEQWLEEEPTLPGNEEQASPEQGPLEPVYPWRHAVILQQKRRMRSNEVHYLDHPLLGLVIKLTPLTGEDLEILARAEAGAGNSPATR
ncbi:MAG: hypothetical protein GWP63_07085 [Haliea sp.]|nr:hypothetical protein [Haliea sp.]